MTILRKPASGALRALVVAAASAALLASASVAAADSRDGYQQDSRSQVYGYRQQDGRGQNYGYRQHGAWGQDQGGDHYWRRGERMGQNDWNTAQPIDYRAHHLRHPPRGYQWRLSNGQYVLAAIATGAIASIVLNSGR